MPPPQDPLPDRPPPRFYPIHPEFGYLVPALSVRRKAWLACKAAVFGAAAGAIAVVALWPSRDTVRVAPILAVAEAHPVPAAIPLPVAARHPPANGRAQDSKPPVAASIAPRPVAAPASDVAPPKPAGTKPVATARPNEVKKTKNVRRKKDRRKDVRPSVRTDPRSAYASPYGRSFQPPRREWSGWPGFGSFSQ